MTPVAHGGDALFKNAFSGLPLKIQSKRKWKQVRSKVKKLTGELGAWCLTYLSADDFLLENESNFSKALEKRLHNSTGSFQKEFGDFMNDYVPLLIKSRKNENDVQLPYTKNDAESIIKSLLSAFELFLLDRKKRVADLLRLLSGKKFSVTMQRPTGGKSETADERNKAVEEVKVEISGSVVENRTPTIAITVSSNNPQSPSDSRLSASLTLRRNGTGTWEIDWGNNSNEKLLLRVLPTVLLSLTAYLFLHKSPLNQIKGSQEISSVLQKIEKTPARDLRRRHATFVGKFLGKKTEGEPAIKFNFNTVTDL